MLARGGGPYDVAKLLGDTVATIEQHYAPFVREHINIEELKTKDFMADGPVSRILCRAQTAERLARAAIIPLGHGSHRDSSSLPEGFQSRLACANLKGARSFSWTLAQ